MKKAQMSDVIEYALAYGAEHGVEWSNPTQDETDERSAA